MASGRSSKPECQPVQLKDITGFLYQLLRTRPEINDRYRTCRWEIDKSSGLVKGMLMVFSPSKEPISSVTFCLEGEGIEIYADYSIRVTGQYPEPYSKDIKTLPTHRSGKLVLTSGIDDNLPVKLNYRDPGLRVNFVK